MEIEAKGYVIAPVQACLGSFVDARRQIGCHQVISAIMRNIH